MIVDSHCHLMGEGWWTGEAMRAWGKYMAAQVRDQTGADADADTLASQILFMMEDTTGEKLVSKMDAAGVDKTCVFTVDAVPATSSQPRVSLDDQNRMVAEAARRFPDRLIPFFAVDPRRPNGLQLFERAVKEWHMRGLKLYPPGGFFPHDTVCHPFYRRCVEYGIPVLFHTGSVPAPLKARFAQPIHIDDVAADFPDLAIIMAHAGALTYEEALIVAAFKPNVYLDLSGWQLIFSHSPSRFYVLLRRLLDAASPWRVFFGSDGPMVDAVLPLDRWVKAFREPDLSTCPDIKFTKEEMEIVMGKAFARLMKLEK